LYESAIRENKKLNHRVIQSSLLVSEHSVNVVSQRFICFYDSRFTWYPIQSHNYTDTGQTNPALARKWWPLTKQAIGFQFFSLWSWPDPTADGRIIPHSERTLYPLGHRCQPTEVPCRRLTWYPIQSHNYNDTGQTNTALGREALIMTWPDRGRSWIAPHSERTLYSTRPSRRFLF